MTHYGCCHRECQQVIVDIAVGPGIQHLVWQSRGPDNGAHRSPVRACNFKVPNASCERLSGRFVLEGFPLLDLAPSG